MAVNIQATITSFNQRLDALARKIGVWVGSDASQRAITMSEHVPGQYSTNEFTFSVSGKYLELKPVGIWMTGCEGVVELRGRKGNKELAFFHQGGPATILEERIGGQPVNRSVHPDFGGEITADWYHINTRNEAQKLDKPFFDEILAQIL